MLYTACEESAPFAELMRNTISRHKPTKDTPWHLIMYSDEIGVSPLGHDARKEQSMYWSCLEFGAEVLCSELVWFIVTAVRAELVQDLVSGMSHMFNLILDIFFDSKGHDIGESGITVPCGTAGEIMLVFAILGIIISDESALHQCFGSKGASGLIPCIECRNVLLLGHLRATGAYVVDISCLDVEKFKRHTDETIIEVLKYLRAQRAVLGKGAFEELEKDLGWKDEPHNMLLRAHPPMKPISILMYDWMHIYLVGGIFNYEVWYFFLFLKRAGRTIEHIHKFVSQWQWPKSTICCSKALDPANVKDDADHLPCSASVGLGLYSVLAVYVETMVVPDKLCEPQARSFLALCDVLDMLISLKHGVVTPDLLRAAIFRHLALYQVAYGLLGWRFKHHQATHLPGHLEKHGTLHPCFVQERHHKLLKRFMRDHYNLHSFDVGIVEEVALQQLYDLKNFKSLSDGLCDPVDPKKRMLRAMLALFPGADIKSSRSAKVKHTEITSGDMALAIVDGERCVAEVWFHVTVDGVCMTCIAACKRQPLGPNRTNVEHHTMVGKPMMAHTNQLTVPLTHMFNSRRDCVTVILPPIFR